MDNEQVTPLLQTTMATAQDKGGGQTDDLLALMLAGHALIDSYQAVNAEMLAFWQSRLKDGLATGARLLECTSADGAVEIQADYAKATLQAYLDQSAKITRLVTQALSGGRAPKPTAAGSKGQTDAIAA